MNKRWTACPRKLRRLLIATALLLTATQCQRRAPLAVLEVLQGDVLRDHAAKPRQWDSAARKDSFFLGDGIKTGAKGHASLRLADASVLKIRPMALLRFQAAPDTERRFDLEMGEVVLELGAHPMRLRSLMGLAVIQPGTRLVIASDGDKARYEVVVGMATFQQADRPELQVKAGQRIVVDLQTAQIEPYAPEPATAKASTPQKAADGTPEHDSVTAFVSGRRVRHRLNDHGRWQNLPPGATHLLDGAQLDLPAGASVALARKDERVTVHGSGYFVVGTDDTLVKTLRGRVTFDGPAGDTGIAVPGGKILVRAVKEGTRGDVVVSARKSATVNVEGGLVIAETRSGSDHVRGGEVLMLSADGAMDVRGRTPDVADLTLAAGESCVVHDPTPPTAVAVEFAARCDKGGRLRIGSHRIVLPKQGSDGAAIAALSTGAYRYAVLCGAGSTPVAEGSLHIIRDEGTSQLPRTPPASLIDADGRNYTILYQNLLPVVQVRWLMPPKADSFELRYETVTATKTIELARPAYTFKPGSLAEGDYRMTFVASSGGREVARSKATAVKIRFDNAAPAAIVRAPANRQFKPGTAVEVAGIALPGWRVSSMGDALTLDPHHRFSGQVLLSANQRALAIRFEHRDRGVHYYLRRPGGKSQ